MLHWALLLLIPLVGNLNQTDALTRADRQLTYDSPFQLNAVEKLLSKRLPMEIRGPQTACTRALYRVDQTISTSDYEITWEYNIDGTGWQFGAYYYQSAGAPFEFNDFASVNSYLDVQVFATRVTWPYDSHYDDIRTLKSCA